MGDSYTEEIREPLTFSAAPLGWRALYVDDDPDHAGGFLVVPLVGWSVFRITIRDAETGDQLPKARTELEGVVLQQGGFLPVSVYEFSDLTRFDSYLDPDQPDPEPGTGPGREKPDGRRRGRGRGRGRVQPPVFDPHPSGGNP